MGKILFQDFPDVGLSCLVQCFSKVAQARIPWVAEATDRQTLH